MATFNAIDLGPFAIGTPQHEPVEYQWNRYPGVDGVQGIRMGARGGRTVMTGAFVAADIPSLAGVIETFRLLQVNSVLGTLVDSLGTSWASVLLVDLRAPGPAVPMADADGAGYALRYEMTFFHLTMPLS